MVYQDIQSENSETKIHKSQPPLLDRFFSFLIDYLVLSPFVSFFVYLFFKDAVIYWRANPTAPEQVSLLFILLISLAFLFSLMQAAFIYLWHATPGQYFLKIQIKFDSSHGFIFWRALLRQLGFWSSPILLGLPWLAIMSHPERKTFYDRLADCQVISLKRSSEAFSFESENRYWQSLFATLVLFVGFLFGATLWVKYEKIVSRVASFKQLEKDKFFCEDLKDVQISQRLQIAIAMNIGGQLSDDCLDKEADFTLWKSKTRDFSLAYFAKSLTEPDKDAENKYLAQACEGEISSADHENSFGCKLARAFESGEFSEIYAELKNHDGLLSDTLKYELGAILEKSADTQKNFQALQKYATHRLVKKYLLTEMLNEKTSAGRSPASSEENSKIYDGAKAEAWIDDL